MDKLFKIISGGELPEQHRDFKKILQINGFGEKLRVILRLLLIHPIKRRLAKYYLLILQKYFGLKVIGITGSAGKTTTKEMLVSILGQQGKTVASFKNIDPIFNIPTTILRCTPLTRYLVLEFGVEYPGEMNFYLWLASPDVGVITNIYPTHLEFFKDIDGVFAEKSRLLKGLNKNAFIALNMHDKYLRSIKISNNVIWFGKDGDLKATISKYDVNKTNFKLMYKDESVETSISIYGKQFVENALAAAAAAIALGFNLSTIAKGLSKFRAAEHRMNVVKVRRGIRIFDDSYNNNPQAAITTISSFMAINPSRKKIIVFGDMLELGDEKIRYHKDIGRFISKYKIEFLVCVGELAKYVGESSKVKKIIYLSDLGKVKKYLEREVNENSDILVKGSHSLHLDSLVGKLFI